MQKKQKRLEKIRYSTIWYKEDRNLLYRNGIDIKIIKELLGHVQIDTTEIYTHLYDKDVMNALQTHSLSSFMMNDAIEFCAA